MIRRVIVASILLLPVSCLHSPEVATPGTGPAADASATASATPDPSAAFTTSSGGILLHVADQSTAADGDYTRVVVHVDVANLGTDSVDLARLDSTLTDAAGTRFLALRAAAPAPLAARAQTQVTFSFDAQSLQLGPARLDVLGLPDEMLPLSVNLQKGKVENPRMLAAEPVLKGIAKGVALVIAAAVALTLILAYAYVCSDGGCNNSGTRITDLF